MSLLPVFLELAERSMLRPFGRFPTIYYRYPQNQYLCHPEINNNSLERSGLEVDVNKDGFKVCMDVKEFAPNEISVKTIDNSIVIEGKHESKEDDLGFISRQFTRRYSVPEGYNIKDVVSQLSADGVLTVKAPAELKAMADNVRAIEIEQTGAAHSTAENKQPLEADSNSIDTKKSNE